MMKINKSVVIMSCILSMNPLLNARVNVTQKKSELFSRVERAPIAIVSYVKFVPTERKPTALDQYEKAFVALSRDTGYQQAGVSFIQANSNKDSSLMPIADAKDNAAIVLYVKGKRVDDKDGKPIALSGYVDQDAIANFIEDNIGQQIDDAWKRAQSKRPTQRISSSQWMPIDEQPRVVERVYQPVYYQPYVEPYVNVGFGYPYGGYYGPGFGYGVGFGGGYGGIGFGFGF